MGRTLQTPPHDCNRRLRCRSLDDTRVPASSWTDPRSDQHSWLDVRRCRSIPSSSLSTIRRSRCTSAGFHTNSRDATSL